MKFTVGLTWRAERDIDQIYLWLAKRSKSGADAWFGTLVKKRHWLADNALACGLAPESNLLGGSIRECVFKTRKGNRYRILFTIEGTEVRILHIRGPGQDLVASADS